MTRSPDSPGEGRRDQKKGPIARPKFWEETSKKHGQPVTRGYVLHRTSEKIMVRNVNFK